MSESFRPMSETASLFSTSSLLLVLDGLGKEALFNEISTKYVQRMRSMAEKDGDLLVKR